MSGTSYTIEGLESRVEVLVDRYGVSHIYAGSERDLFFAQGWNAARDRLWQIDLWRRRGLGLLSEALGRDYLEQDRAARLFLYRGDMDREWEACSPGTRQVVRAFVEGINAYIGLTGRETDLLPPEFGALGYRPARWSPEDVVRVRSGGLYRNVEEEVARAITLRDFGPEVERLRSVLEPEREISVPEGLDLGLISEEVLGVYRLATGGVEFSPGSNNWVISPQRSTTGRPILANDPHRDQSVPSLRYAVHLSAPGLDVIGAGEPALPGISLGHNGRIAFGLTIFPIDQEDLYVYETRPGSPQEYRYNGGWEHMRVVREGIPVRDGDPVEVELKYTRHGPVIREDREKRAAFAVRAAWLEPGSAPYLGGLGCMRAGNWEEFVRALRDWRTPGENLVYADTSGNIGWKATGLVPRRPNWDGLLPVPGDGRYEWDWFLRQELLPEEVNPTRGWISTANQMNLPDGYPAEERKVSFEWYPPFRQQRISEVIESSPRFGLEGSLRLQTDHLSVPARRVVAVLAGLRSDDPAIEEALELLQGWDCVLDEGSAAAALFEVWYRLHLRPEALRRLLPERDAERALAALTADAFESDAEIADPRAVLDLIKAPDERFGPDPDAARDEALLSSLGEAAARLQRLLGPDPQAWRWGDLHKACFQHPLSGTPAARRIPQRLDAGPFPRGGSGDTVGNTGYRAQNFRQTGGASWRMVLDIGEWDNSLAMNAPGQSGDPRSPHYADLAPAWARGEAFPLLYSRQRVEEETYLRILLDPEGKCCDAER